MLHLKEKTWKISNANCSYDTLGAMVKNITSEGRLKYNKIGGGSWASIEGENCYIITRHGKNSWFYNS